MVIRIQIPTEKKARTYTRRVLIDGVVVLVTLHPDKIELRQLYGRRYATWSHSKLWQAAEGKLL